MYARIQALAVDRHEPVPDEMSLEYSLTGDVTEEIIVDFIRTIFREDSISYPSLSGSKLKTVRIITMDFREPDQVPPPSAIKVG